MKDDPRTAPPTPEAAITIPRTIAAWSVHVFTASGAVLGLLALLAISRGAFAEATVFMLITLAIDSMDGSFARAVGVAWVTPRFNGRRLDDIVDFLNFVIVPAFFMVNAGSLPHAAWAALPVLASCYGFSQEDAKTKDDFFLGFPSYWNVLAFYLWLLEISSLAGAAWVLVLSIAVFIPLRYVYPSKLSPPWLRYFSSYSGLLWSLVLAAAVLWPEATKPYRLIEISLAYPIYYIALSAYLGRWGRR